MIVLRSNPKGCCGVFVGAVRLKITGFNSKTKKKGLGVIELAQARQRRLINLLCRDFSQYYERSAMILAILKSISVAALNRGIYRVVRGSWVSVFRPEQTDQTRLINKSEVAILFGVSKETIDRWVKDGKLPQPKRNVFSARWHYEELVPLVKFKSNKAKSVSESSISLMSPLKPDAP